MIETEKVWDQEAVAAWENFIAQEQLSANQAQRYKQYVDALLAWNQKSNLTRIVNIPDIVAYHLQDSIRVDQYAEFSTEQRLCDIGSGAGFPGIPLAIKRPDLKMVLIEVNQKKVAFLRHVIELLQLKDVLVLESDWRTFLRHAPLPVDWFLARASLQMDELMRFLRPSCAYRNSMLIYWASDHWRIEDAQEPFFIKKEAYTVDSVRRWYVFFGQKSLKNQ